MHNHLVILPLALCACSASSPPGAPDASSPGARDAAAAETGSDVRVDVSPLEDGGHSASAAVNVVAPPLVAPSGGCTGGTDGGSPGYCDFFEYVAPHITGVVLNLSWSTVDNCNGKKPCFTPCAEGSSTNGCNWSTFDAEVQQFVRAGLDVNVIAGPASDISPNTVTPAYVFSTQYAATLPGHPPPQDLAVCPLYAGDADAPVHGASHDGVWNVDSCYTAETGTTCSGSDDISGIPIIYEVPVMTAYQGFIKNLFKHFSASGTGLGPQLAPHIGYIRTGTLAGGESFVDCYETWPAPTGLDLQHPPPGSPPFFTSTEFLSGYISAMDSFIASQKPSMSIVVSAIDGPGNDVSYANEEALLAEKNGLGFGMESLALNDYELDALGMPCTQNWCENFERYAGNRTTLYLQTTPPALAPTFPLSSVSVSKGSGTASCTGTCQLANLPRASTHQDFGYIKLSGNSNGSLDGYFDFREALAGNAGFTFVASTGTSGMGMGGVVYTPDYLPTILPFAVQRHATALELNVCDLYYAFDPQPVPGKECGPPGPYSSLYASTISGISGR
jgi:hypothetical protein